MLDIFQFRVRFPAL